MQVYVYYEKRASKRATRASGVRVDRMDGRLEYVLVQCLLVKPTLLLPPARCLRSSSTEVEGSPGPQEAL